MAPIFFLVASISLLGILSFFRYITVSAAPLVFISYCLVTGAFQYALIRTNQALLGGISQKHNTLRLPIRLSASIFSGALTAFLLATLAPLLGNIVVIEYPLLAGLTFAMLGLIGNLIFMEGTYRIGDIDVSTALEIDSTAPSPIEFEPSIAELFEQENALQNLNHKPTVSRIDKGADKVTIFLDAARVLKAQAAFAEAANTLENVFRFFGTSVSAELQAEILQEKGECQMLCEEYMQAEASFTQALEVVPNHGAATRTIKLDCLMGLVQCYLETQKYEAALVAYSAIYLHSFEAGQNAETQRLIAEQAKISLERLLSNCENGTDRLLVERIRATIDSFEHMRRHIGGSKF